MLDHVLNKTILMFAAGSYHLYKLHLDRRPADMNHDDAPFFLTPGSSSKNCWVRRTPMGINKLYGIMNEMKQRSDIDDPRITHYR